MRYSFNRFQFDEIPLLLPPLNEQKLIVGYLDKKIQHLDLIVKNIYKKIELIKEHKNALINQYITKGLNPDVDMKDSNIEWIGKIPKHWDVLPLFVLFGENKVKNTENRLDILTLSYGKIKYRDMSKTEGIHPESFDGYQVMNIESIIIRSTDLQNDHKSLRVGYVGVPGVITSAYLGLNPKTSNNSKFYYYLIHLADLKKVLYGLGSGLRQSLRYDEFKRFPMLNPPYEEQIKISEKLDFIDDKYEKLIKKLNKRIYLLNEYSRSLISLAVMGKFKITEDML
jgi:type I restriction enzyme S subunit